MKCSLRDIDIAFTPSPRAVEEGFGVLETLRKDGKTMQILIWV